MTTLKAGDSGMFYCLDCLIEYRITYEPMAKEDPASAAALTVQKDICEPKYCPFCGADDSIEDADDAHL